LLKKLILLALAGAVGTLLRYGLAGLVHRMNGVSFPWGTLVVNICGCFAAGLLWTVFETRWPVSSQVRTVVLIGFLGAFTTFSAYILETGEMARSAAWGLAAANLFLQNALGLVALFAGATVGRLT